MVSPRFNRPERLDIDLDRKQLIHRVGRQCYLLSAGVAHSVRPRRAVRILWRYALRAGTS
jgi:hypothetical protein